MTKASKQADATIASANTDPTFLEIIVDETTSMWPFKASTIDAFNGFIADQSKLEDDNLRVSMTKFSTAEIVTPYECLPLNMVPKMNSNTFNPQGSTNLYDVIGQRINALSEKIGDLKCNVLFMVLTDGEDNQSRTETATSIKRMLGEKMDKNGWTFVYLGAHDHALTEAVKMGFPEGNIQQFKTTDIQKAFVATSDATAAYRSARASGLVATASTTRSYFSGEE
jgi:hypothetical protein